MVSIETTPAVYDVSAIQEELSSLLEPLGLEAHPFKVCWYNDQVKQAFKLKYHDDTLAFCLVSTPSMFENGFLPFLNQADLSSTKDPIDQIMTVHLQKVKSEFHDLDIEIIHDFEVMPNRRPKILVQTAGHVSGAAYYYQKTDVSSESLNPEKKYFGVSVHPKYAGWFSFRGALIFKNVQAANLEKKDPVDIVKEESQKVRLLEQFNFNWQDWGYRDIVPSSSQYSAEQKTYFLTPPAQRLELLQSLLSS